MNDRPTPDETPLDPVVRAVAEARAREAGKTISDYLADLLLVSHGPTALQLLAGSAAGVSEPGSQEDPWRSAFSQHLLATARDIRDHHDRDFWAALVSGPAPWLASETTVSPALKLVFIFNYRVQSAALLMSAAFHEARVDDFDFAAIRSMPPHHREVEKTWYQSVLHNVLRSSQQLQNALVHKWTPTPRAERLAIHAFVLLSDLTPARTELLRLCRYDRSRAFSELARHIDLAASQFRLSADLIAEIDGPSFPSQTSFSDVSRALLERAGGSVSLTGAAKLLGISRQALHKRVKLGSALGLMNGTELTLPKFQFVEAGQHSKIVAGLGKVVKVFDESKAGRWSALQFLIEKDPNLGDVPTHALSQGRVQEVVDAAVAYLDADAG